MVPEDRSFSDFDLVASLLLPSEDDAEDSETENVLREATLLLLRLFYAHACAQLEGVDQEIQLLRNAPPPPPLPKPPVDERRYKTKDQEDMWKLDAAPELPNRGPLLDSHGKVGANKDDCKLLIIVAAVEALYHFACKRVGPHSPACTSFWAWPPSTNHDYRRILGNRATARGYSFHRRVNHTARTLIFD